jgi:hypothetical protein
VPHQHKRTSFVPTVGSSWMICDARWSNQWLAQPQRWLVTILNLWRVAILNPRLVAILKPWFATFSAV